MSASQEILCSMELFSKLYFTKIEVTRRRGRRRKQLLDDLGDRRGYSHLKEEALDRIKWRNLLEEAVDLSCV
jgi:hypothetical protein